MPSTRAILGLVGAFGLTACATAVPPSGPTVLVLPPEGKNLGRFQQEDANCRNYASSQIGSVIGANNAESMQTCGDWFGSGSIRAHGGGGGWCRSWCGG